MAHTAVIVGSAVAAAAGLGIGGYYLVKHRQASATSPATGQVAYSQYQSVEAQIKTVKQQYASLQSQIAANKTQIAQLQRQLKSLQAA